MGKYLLDSATNEIKDIMLNSDSRKSDGRTRKVIQQANEYFNTISNELEEALYTGRASGDLEELREALSWADISVPTDDETDLAIEDECSAVDKIFPQFPPVDLSFVLSTSEKSAVTKILPYLLTCFYLKSNVRKKLRTTIKDEFDVFDNGNEKREHSGAYYRDVEDFCQLFSYVDFLPSLFNCGGDNPKTHIDRIADEEMLIAYCRGIHDGTARTKDFRLYYSQAYKAFIYSAIASACEEVLKVDVHVDYKASWELFDEHTLAFSSVFKKRMASKEIAHNLKTFFSSDMFWAWYNDFAQESWLDAETCVKKVEDFRVDYREYLERDWKNTSTFEDQNIYKYCTYFFRMALNPGLYPPFQYPQIFKNLLIKGHMAYIVIHPRSGRKLHNR